MRNIYRRYLGQVRVKSCEDQLASGRRRLHSHPPTNPVVSEDSSTSDLTATVRRYFEKQQPAVLRNAISDSEQALTQWKSLDYLEKVVDPDAHVTVEVGGSYNMEGSRADIRFADYVLYLRFFEEEYGRSNEIPPPPEKLVYLAQNDVPRELHRDFTVPPFCTFVGEGRLYSTMIWIGPYGCVSPLHFDPLDNALMQFAGSKRVLMFPPSAQVYAGHDGNQSNTSPIDPEIPFDLENYPLLTDLPPALECTLYPGDILYIPSKWWHHVRTLETSISVNAWWR